MPPCCCFTHARLDFSEPGCVFQSPCSFFLDCEILMASKWHQRRVAADWFSPASRSLLAVFLIIFPPHTRLRNASMLYLWWLVGLFSGISPLYFFDGSFVSRDLFFLVCTPVWKRHTRGKKLSLFRCYACLSVFNVPLCSCARLRVLVCCLQSS